MAAPGAKSFFTLEYHTSISVLLCNVHFVQSAQRTCLQTTPFVRGINNLLKLGVCVSRNQVVAHYPLNMTLNGFEPVFCIVRRNQRELQLRSCRCRKTEVWRVLRKRLVFKLYRNPMAQQLSDEDHRLRLDFCLQLQDLMCSDEHFLEISLGICQRPVIRLT
jgi:hypothetical protein